MKHSGCLLQGRRLREGPERWKQLGVKFAESALGSTSVSPHSPSSVRRVWKKRDMWEGWSVEGGQNPPKDGTKRVYRSY